MRHHSWAWDILITELPHQTPSQRVAGRAGQVTGYPLHAQGNISQRDRHRQTASCLNRGSTTRVAWPAEKEPALRGRSEKHRAEVTW